MHPVYVVALVIFVGAFAWQMVVRSRALGKPSAGADERPYDLLEAAFIAGGPGRVADTVVCAMQDDGRIEIDAVAQVHIIRPNGNDPVERELLSLCGDEWESPLETLRGELMRSAPVQAIGDTLVNRGLIWRARDQRAWRYASHTRLTVSVLCGLFTLLDWQIGIVSEIHGPYGFLIPMFIIASVVTVFKPNKSGLTKGGRRALEQLEKDNPWAPKGLTKAAPAALVAVGGVWALSDVKLREQFIAAAVSNRASTETAFTSSGGGAGVSCGGSGGCGISSCGGSGGDSGGGGGGGGCGSGGGGGN